jgi:hypothetical protein
LQVPRILPRQALIAGAALVATLALPSAVRAQVFTPALDLPLNYPGHIVVWAWGFHDQLERLPEFTGTFATTFGDVADGTSGATDIFVSPLPPPPPVVYTGTIQPPINVNGSSVYTAKRALCQ